MPEQEDMKVEAYGIVTPPPDAEDTSEDAPEDENGEEE